MGKSPENKKPYVVYWAHLPRHTDIFKYGYVGITHNFPERRRAHLKLKKKTPFTSAIAKYRDQLVWDLLQENLSYEDALELEREYRPIPSIGWNHLEGGLKGVGSEFYENPANAKRHSTKTSEGTKQGIARKDTREKRSARAKQVWQRPGYAESREGLFSGQNNPQSGKFGEKHPAYGHKKTEEQRKRIGAAHKGKVLSAETKKKLSDKKKKISLDLVPERIKHAVCQRRQSRASIKELSEEFGIGTKLITRLCLEWGKENGYELWKVKSKPRREYKGQHSPSSKVTDDDRKKICRRRLAGESYASIAKDFPLSLTGVRAICATWGPLNGFEENEE